VEAMTNRVRRALTFLVVFAFVCLVAFLLFIYIGQLFLSALLTYLSQHFAAGIALWQFFLAMFSPFFPMWNWLYKILELLFLGDKAG
jgi:hypothetical protein